MMNTSNEKLDKSFESPIPETKIDVSQMKQKALK